MATLPLQQQDWHPVSQPSTPSSARVRVGGGGWHPVSQGYYICIGTITLAIYKLPAVVKLWHTQFSQNPTASSDGIFSSSHKRENLKPLQL